MVDFLNSLVQQFVEESDSGTHTLNCDCYLYRIKLLNTLVLLCNSTKKIFNKYSTKCLLNNLSSLLNEVKIKLFFIIH